ncbi:hypothetical protein AOA81_01440 [Methanomassiliicoccales archaeon RumEn M2]|nr:hypothetical protein AOA81_01440 [Methanomassiliicoccales archaeon RumEn M2]
MEGDGTPLTELLRQINRFVDDLEHSLNDRIDLHVECDNAILCGMGGSAISGDVVADLCVEVSDIQIEVLRYPSLPGWVSKRTFAVVSSYSGNTHETLSMYREAAGKGCPVAVICSGGEIEKVAKERGDYVVKVPAGIQPRQSIGFMIGYISKMMDLVAGTDVAGMIRDTIPRLREYNNALNENDGDNAAILISEAIQDKIPVICVDEPASSIAMRWRSQLAENSKISSFSWIMPEFNHNEIVGWIETPREELLPILLMPSVHPECMNGIPESTNATLEKNGVSFYKVSLEGKNRTECLLKALILGGSRLISFG